MTTAILERATKRLDKIRNKVGIIDDEKLKYLLLDEACNDEKLIERLEYITTLQEEIDKESLDIQKLNNKLAPKRTELNKILDNLKTVLVENGVTDNFDKESYKVKITKSEAVIIKDADKVPIKYKRHVPETYEPDKHKIKTLLKDKTKCNWAYLDRTYGIKVNRK